MTVQQKLIKNKMGLLELASYLGNVSEACRAMGYSRDTFYRVKNAYDSGGMDALMEKSRSKPNLRNRVDPEVEKAVIDLALEDPSLGQKRASNELRERGVFISAAGVRSVWVFRPKWPLIPVDSGHPVRLKAATDSGEKRPLPRRSARGDYF